MSASFPTTSAKPRSKSEEKRISILAAATDRFLTQGFATTTMDQVAEQAGVSKQTVYSHFGNKEALFTACITLRCEQNPVLVGYEFDFENIRSSFEKQLCAFTDLIASPEATSVYRICAAEAATNPQISRLFYEAGPARVKSEMSRIMAEAKELGLLSIDDPYTAAIQLLGMVHGEMKIRFELNVEPLPTPEARYAYVRQCVDTFLKAYATGAY